MLHKVITSRASIETKAQEFIRHFRQETLKMKPTETNPLYQIETKGT
jgi:hypothetical protein